MQFKVVLMNTLLLAFSGYSQAVELTIGQSYSDLPVNLSGTMSNVTPSGDVIGLSFELTPDVFFSIDHVKWQDTTRQSKQLTSQVDSASTALTGVFYLDNLLFTLNYTHWQSDFELKQQSQLIKSEETSAPSYGVSVGYGKFYENWYIEPSVSIQYAKWRYSNGHGFSFSDHLEDESVLLSSLLSVSYIKPINEESYFISGAILRYNLLAESGFKHQPVFVPTSSSHVSQDEHYGELSFFITYDITQHWLIEIDANATFSLDENHQSIGWRIGYTF